jgi:hypothetical protein
MDKLSELQRFACMILKGAKIWPRGSAEYWSARSFVAGGLALRYAPSWRKRLEREGYRLFTCSR